MVVPEKALIGANIVVKGTTTGQLLILMATIQLWPAG
jgi:hypothetical protein